MSTANAFNLLKKLNFFNQLCDELESFNKPEQSSSALWEALSFVTTVFLVFSSLSHCIFMSSVMILDNYSELIRDLAVFTSMKLDDVMMVAYFLTFDFKLALLALVFEVDEKSHNACKQQCRHSSTSNTRCFKHNPRSGGCWRKISF